MTKSNIVDVVAQQTGLKKKDADAAVNAVFASLTNAFANGEKVQIAGFGTFEVKERGERTGRNPFTGETMKIAASKHVAFSAGKALKDAVK